MCLSMPATILEVRKGTAQADLMGNKVQIGTDLVDDLKAGDHVLVHAGYAIARIDERDAEELRELWAQMGEPANESK